MLLKDLTKEQGIEITNLAYPFPDTIKSDISFNYQGYDPTMWEDACELITLVFNCLKNNYEEITLRVFIFTDLTMEVSYYDVDGFSVETLPIRNAYFIYKKFREWGIYPNIIEQRDVEIDKIL